MYEGEATQHTTEHYICKQACYGCGAWASAEKDEFETNCDFFKLLPLGP